MDEALDDLCKDIYCSSLEVGPEHIDTSAGYFLMANIFYAQRKVIQRLAVPSCTRKVCCQVGHAQGVTHIVLMYMAVPRANRQIYPWRIAWCRCCYPLHNFHRACRWIMGSSSQLRGSSAQRVQFHCTVDDAQLLYNEARGLFPARGPPPQLKINRHNLFTAGGVSFA